MIKSIIIALALSMINTASALLFIKLAYKKQDNKSFTNIVFGSMVIRYFAIVIIMWLLLKYINLESLAFSVTFVISTFILITSEIIYLNSRSKFLFLQNNLNK